MTHSIDLEELAFVATVMERAHRLLDAEEKSCRRARRTDSKGLAARTRRSWARVS
ncbi:hypothetical protein [Streptomyces sp. Ac-502]|uniref:hypothetical protein n=1 Tax=Streptomyces sp. Ac-502 TaxID=3342801 RepID=UPI0038625846